VKLLILYVDQDLIIFEKCLYSVIGAVLIMVGLYMVLWGKSKEMKKVTHLEINQIVVIVTPTDVDPENINNNHTNSKSNIVGKDLEHDNDSSKCEHERQHNKENNGKQELVSILEVES
jgi:hypothetical protein